MKLTDCRGNVHPSEDSKREADHEIVAEIIDAANKWACDYTEHQDYGDGYVFVALESDSANWNRNVREWLDSHYDYYLPEYTLRALAGAIVDRIDDCDIEAAHQRNEYASWAGVGCCLFSFAVGEEEEQICLGDHPELKALHASGGLEGALKAYNGDAYVYQFSHYCAETKTRVEDGHVWDGPHPYVTIIANPGGAWHYVVPEERMEELLAAAIIEICRENDG